MLGYNKMTGYNIARYNADGFELTRAESITMTDDTITRSITKSATELLVMADTTAKQQNKSVEETVDLDIWLRLKKDQAGLWGD